MEPYALTEGAGPFAASADLFTTLVEDLQSAETAGLTAFELESLLAERGREVQRQLLQDHLDLRAAREEQTARRRHPAATGADGITRTRIETGHHRLLATLFGTVRVTRCAWRRPGTPNLYPADAEEELFGKHVLITDHDNWPVAEVVAAYRSQSEAESGFRQLKDTRIVSFSPMHHWTEHNIRVHVFTCVLALQIAQVMRVQAERAGLHMSVRVLLAELAGIGETILLYQGERGRPRAHRMLDDTSPLQDQLSGIFGLARYAPSR